MLEATAPRYRRLDPAERRESILAAGTRLFSMKPYEQVSAGDIAREAGVVRGLINHYFGTKRQLYLEVVARASTVPPSAVAALPAGDLAARIEAAVQWFLTSLHDSGGSWLAASASSGLGRDSELEKILSRAEDDSVDRVIDAVGLGGDVAGAAKLRAVIRPYGQLARAAGREWLLKQTLTRAQAHQLLSATLTAIVRDVYPALPSADT